MRRRGFLGKATGGAVFGGAAATTGLTQESPVRALMRTPAVVMSPRAHGVEVVWAVSTLCRGWVEWKGRDGSSGKAGADRFGFVPQGDEILRVRVEGLRPGTQYALRAITEAAGDGKVREEGPWKEFRTLDPAGDATRFVVWNDTHQNEETIRRLHASTPEADFLIWNGDTCNDWLERDWLVPVLLHPAGQDISNGRPLLVVWGNHDVRGKWAFKMPEMIATPEGRPFYAFRSGPLAVICLNTGEDKPDNHPSFGGRVAFEALRREQVKWLAETIVRPEFREAPYRIVFCHIPLRWLEEPEDAGYESGGFDRYARSSRDLWHEALVAWKTQAVISGHTHRAAWIPPSEGFPYGQFTGGGPRPEGATWIEGEAGEDGLKLVMKDLSGNEIERAEWGKVV